MSSDRPRITIGMPVYNDVAFIAESIESILNQTMGEFELILADDNSTDGSGEICRNFAQKDPRVRYVLNPTNLGISANMKRLLTEAETPYFMWAGDDDLYEPEFIEEGLKLLENNPEAIVAFSPYQTINENGKTIREISNTNFTSKSAYQRLRSLILNPDDGPGYGIFRTEAIVEVSFPTWWWPNRKTPYNNIYPTMCFYLAKGNYLETNGKPLFFKRIKSEGKTNHKLVGQGNAFYETFAYTIRRFNLVTFSSREIRKAHSFGLMLRIYPTLWYRWFLVSSFQQFRLAFYSFFRNRVFRKS